MKRPHITQSTLDRIISAIEEDILRTSDEEILRETESTQRDAQRVRALITRQIDVRGRDVPREPMARRQWLAELLRVRPGLSPTLSATFSSRKPPSDSEVDAVIHRLLKRGVLKKRKTGARED